MAEATESSSSQTLTLKRAGRLRAERLIAERQRLKQTLTLKIVKRESDESSSSQTAEEEFKKLNVKEGEDSNKSSRKDGEKSKKLSKKEEEEATRIEVRTVDDVTLVDVHGENFSDVVQVDSVSSHLLGQILSYFAEQTRLAGEEDDLKKYEEEFVAALSLDEMKEMIITAHRLRMRKLVLLLSRSIANGIRNKTVEFVREFFGVVNDYTPDEEEAYRKENDWVFENIEEN
ncbi:hypothetical protein VNO78_13238 [Psophocarpus tetragonolobus]|uniref:SKP1 component dimerisation domain-containing protein n=1 Tax=Psophocarpus tetragonolobus TaxID=3891 RepID=A0AAN9XPW2_PSOTE